jgi:hypothetical protein
MKRMKKVLFASFFFALPVAAAPVPGACEMHVTGDLNLNIQVPQTILGFSAPGDAAAETDYWKTDEQLRSEYVAIRTAMDAVEIKGLPTTTASVEEIKRGAEAMLAKDPKSVVLSIICGKDQVLLTLDNGKGVKYANVPMKPGSYKILPIRDAGPSDMTGIVIVTISGKPTHYEIVGQGQLDLTQFDLKGIAGKFSLEAQKSTGRIKVFGQFHYICQGKRCTQTSQAA